VQKSETRNQNSESPEVLHSGLCILNSELSPSRPRTLFATHYHELTDITLLLPRCRNFSFTVKEQRGQVLFMRKLKEGPADKSYGVAVARLAGLPPAVIERAKQVQADFEKGEALSIGQLAPDRGLLAADKPPEDPILQDLRATDIEKLSPLQAFDLLLHLKQRLDEHPPD